VQGIVELKIEEKDKVGSALHVQRIAFLQALTWE